MKRKVKRPKARIYPLLAETVERGVRFGLHRAWKHREDDEPGDDVLNCISEKVMLELAEAFDLSD